MGTKIMIYSRNDTIPKNFQKKKANTFGKENIIRILPSPDQNLNDQ
jgi:hypothetical protein